MVQELREIEAKTGIDVWEETIREPKVEKLVVSLNEIGSSLKPAFDLEHGYRYPEAEELLEESPFEAAQTLARLSGLGILDKELHDKSLSCPKCSSPNISINYICPYDGSKDITKDSLITHLVCGYIDSRSNFIQEEEGLACPRCKQTLTPGSYRITGSWSQCNVCNRRLETLSTGHRCRKCGHEFTFEEAKFDDSFVYTLNQQVREEISRGLIYLSQFRKTLEDNGYTITTPPNLKDPSGMEYNFDIVAGDSKGMTISVDINFSDIPFTRDQIIEKFGKYSATNKTSILVLVPKLESDINKLVESIGMVITQADNPSGALHQFSERVSKLKAEKLETSRSWNPLVNLIKRKTRKPI